jgi:hypothetical protein
MARGEMARKALLERTRYWLLEVSDTIAETLSVA